MKADQVVQTRVNGEVKAQATAVLAAIGLNVSDAIRMLLIKIAQEKELPFSPIIPNETTINAMKEAQHKKLERYKTVKDALDALNEGD